MSRDTLTGSRIRERRIILGLRQADLARQAQISPSYLNLIEHNRRRIGGKLLLDLAHILQVEPTLLSEGAEGALIAALNDALSRYQGQGAEGDRTEEFAGRFPGWARVIKTMLERQISLEQTVASLTDRMTHDPQLSEALYDVLGAVTSIRSTSSILVETEELEPEWRDRFYRNINEDAARLAEGSQALASYLNAEVSGTMQAMTPQDEIESFFLHNGYHFPDLDLSDVAQDPALLKRAINQLLEQAGESVVSASAKAQIRTLLSRYAQDGLRLSKSTLFKALATEGLSPVALARNCAVDLGCIMRRLAHVPGAQLAELVQSEAYDLEAGGVGLAMCDASGTLTFRKSVSGFALPRFGAACSLWALYQSLSRPMTPLQEMVVQSDRDAGMFDTFAITQPQHSVDFNEVPLWEAHMLIVPLAGDRDRPAAERHPIGVSCRVCSRQDCPGRREPSILESGL